jgi:hypothetical protein
MPKAAAKEKAPKAAAKKGKAPAKSPAKAKKEKKEKDPNAPKRPLGAYFLFSNDMRAKVSLGDMPGAGYRLVERGPVSTLSTHSTSMLQREHLAAPDPEQQGVVGC